MPPLTVSDFAMYALSIIPKTLADLLFTSSPYGNIREAHTLQGKTPPRIRWVAFIGYMTEKTEHQILSKNVKLVSKLSYQFVINDGR